MTRHNTSPYLLSGGDLLSVEVEEGQLLRLNVSEHFGQELDSDGIGILSHYLEGRITVRHQYLMHVIHSFYNLPISPGGWALP